MKSTNNALVRLSNIMTALNSNKILIEHHQNAIAILASVSQNCFRNKPLTVTNLVNMHVFGSLPTVLRRIKELEVAGFVSFKKGCDLRLNLIISTEAGNEFLKRCSEAMENALDELDQASL